jgi:hypothetical protein
MDVASRNGGTRGCARRNLHVCGAASRCCGSQAGPLWGAHTQSPAGGHRSGVADEVAAADAIERGDDSPSTSADRAMAARPLCSSARGFCQLLMVRTHHHQNFGWLAVERGVRSRWYGTMHVVPAGRPVSALRRGNLAPGAGAQRARSALVRTCSNSFQRVCNSCRYFRFRQRRGGNERFDASRAKLRPLADLCFARQPAAALAHLAPRRAASAFITPSADVPCRYHRECHAHSPPQLLPPSRRHRRAAVVVHALAT